MNIQQIMKQAQEMQSKMDAMQKKLGETELTGTAGGGMVTATINGKGDLLKVNIDPEMLTADEKEVLEDLIVAAYMNAKGNAEKMFHDQMAEFTGGALPPGFKMPM